MIFCYVYTPYTSYKYINQSESEPLELELEDEDPEPDLLLFLSFFFFFVLSFLSFLDFFLCDPSVLPAKTPAATALAGMFKIIDYHVSFPIYQLRLHYFLLLLLQILPDPEHWLPLSL